MGKKNVIHQILDAAEQHLDHEMCHRTLQSIKGNIAQAKRLVELLRSTGRNLMNALDGQDGYGLMWENAPVSKTAVEIDVINSLIRHELILLCSIVNELGHKIDY